MNRRKLIQILRERGFRLIRKSKHEIWMRDSDKRIITVSMGKVSPGGWFNKFKRIGVIFID